MARMVGALGWHGQCACCCGRDEKSTIKAQEERQWRSEAEDELREEGTVMDMHDLDDVEQIKRLSAERDAAFEAIGRVRQLHRPLSGGHISGIYIEPRCAHCKEGIDRALYPCATIRTLDGSP